MKTLAVFLLFFGLSLAAQTAPGTSSRPILTSSEASGYTKAKYLQGWSPPSITGATADYIVGSGGYGTIQEAVNAAINAGGSTRKYIKIAAGTYKQTVYVPKTSVPLTIYGGGSKPADTKITLNMPAQTTPSAYKNLVNSGGNAYKSGDPAWSIYNGCATKSGTIGTSCSTVFWIQSENVQVANVQIENTAKNSGDNQAVALYVKSDKVQINNVNLIGHQDTLCVGSGGTTVQRSHITNTYIEGDIDFVFGGGSAVFEKCTFHAKADRRSDISIVFAPNTDPNISYGFLVISSTITADSSFQSSKAVKLARAWDSGVSSASAYVAGTSPNGQLVIRETSIGGIINTSAPYNAATSGRSYSGNPSSSRNLNNNSYNRFWEYQNSGSGA